jgi:geranylgeranyl reductase family protein
MERFDAIIVGAGPAGSSTALRLASAGAHVLLLDKASFPREKPCGGGVTERALRECPTDIQSVVEQVVDRIEFSFRGRRTVSRGGCRPLVHMTQRQRLDELLVERAAAAGAVFRDGVRVEDISARGTRVDGRPVACELLIGADGVNGGSARSLGLGGDNVYAVALEGNLPLRDVVEAERWRGVLALELGTLLGGYGWIFPKADHLNIGVGGWQSEGRHIREHFRAFCLRSGFDPDAIVDRRGYRLVARRPGCTLASPRALIVGDAAGLVDPLLGDGISAALVSARLAASAALDLLAGRTASLEPYGPAVTAELGPSISFSWNAKLALDRLPRTVMLGVLSPPGWRVIEALTRGELPQPRAARGSRGAAIWGLEALARLTARPGDAYRVEAQAHRRTPTIGPAAPRRPICPSPSIKQPARP